jgi:spermidine/putrescine transport system ATP-binding protein
MTDLLEVRQVVRQFAGMTAVNQVSFTVKQGEFFTLLGPSGCGKTTLLRMIAGFDEPDAGDLLLDGRSLRGVPPEQRPIHTVFQSYALFPHMTVADNIAFPLKMAKKDQSHIQQRTRDMLDLIQLSDKAQRLPHELSGGQRQRVALARSLVNQPRLLLLDEPLGALDAKLREQMQYELIRLQRDTGITFIFVTHSQEEALALSHRIAVMNAGQVAQLATPQTLYTRPANRFVADFIGNISLLPATVLQVSNDFLTLDIPSLNRTVLAPMDGVATSTIAGATGHLALRPEWLVMTAVDNAPETVGQYPNRVQGVVRDVLYVGGVSTFVIQTESGATLEVLRSNDSQHLNQQQIGDRVCVAWEAESGVFLDR